MKKISQINNYPVFILTKELAKKYQKQITEIWNLIPLSNHSIDDILLESKGTRINWGKWQHSLIVIDQEEEKVIAFIVGFEREAEDNDQYPQDSLHLKTISVSKDYQKQGIGRKLTQVWLDFNKVQGFKHLDGNFSFSVQTNGADWNKHVQDFYTSFCFKQTGTKEYKDKTDNIYFLD
jgi:ribosomal protein S18 acetylase RimI-like enzyme